MDNILVELRKIPTVTRTLCAVSVAVTVPVMLNAVPPYPFYYIQKLVFSRFEIHRIPLSFLFNRTDIYYLFDLFALYQHSNQLETGPFSLHSADYAWQLLIACAGILLIDTPLTTLSHFRPLIVTLAYLSSAIAPPGAQTSLMGLVNLPIAFLPYTMIGIELVMGGPRAAGQATGGAIVGFVWWWLIFGRVRSGGVRGVDMGSGAQGSGWWRAPGWLVRLIGNGGGAAGGSGGAAATTSGGGGVHVIPPRRFAGEAAANRANRPENSATTSGYQWGSTGQKLGNR